MEKIKIKVCAFCSVKPVIEMWSSAGSRFAVRCNNPERGNECDHKFYASISNSYDEAVKIWNELN